MLAKGFATIDHVALINVEGTGMVGVHGTASDIFSSVRDAGVNVIMISQASSEHSVCFAVNQSDGDRAVQALNSRYLLCLCLLTMRLQSRYSMTENLCISQQPLHNSNIRHKVLNLLLTALEHS